jgi:hypothetical protein
MLRQSITRPAVIANRALCQRSFSAIAPRMGEGDTGAPRSGGGGTSGYVAKSPNTSFPASYLPCGVGAVALSAFSTAWRVRLVAVV